MRRSLLVFLTVALCTFLILGVSWAQCPEDDNDPGVCDTLKADPFKYTNLGSFPADVEVALFYTHDLPTAATDSIAGFIIPLCFTSTNATANATILAGKNNTNVYPYPGLDQSIYRHLPTMDTLTATHRNWMMDRSYFFGPEWDTRILDLSAQSDIFWLSEVVTGTADQGYGPGGHVLLATMTITVDDTTTLCIDSCFWPPTNRLQCSNASASVFIPRHNLPICFSPSLTGVREIPGSEDNRPSEVSLSQNYPNPFNPETYIEFDLSKATHVKIDVFNIVGQRVRTLVDEDMEPGKYVADWDSKDEQGNSVSSGIYFYRMQAADFSDMKKMLLVK